MRVSLPLLLLILATGCAPRVEPIPPAARTQHPAAAMPDGAWQAHGRLSVSWPRHHAEFDCWLRRDHERLRYALVADGGISLAQGAIPSTGSRTVHADLAQHIDELERLLAVYAIAAPAEAAWDGDVRILATGQGTQWFGGDPVLLRAITGGGWPLRISDYRSTAIGLVAHEAIADGPWGAAIRLRLVTVKADPSPAAQP